MISGFQNPLHALYGFPGGWADNSDILSRGGTRKRKRAEELAEEALAIEMLRARQQSTVVPETVNPVKLSKILEQKLNAAPLPGEVAGAERSQRIRLLLLALALDE